MTEPILTPFLGATDVTVYQGDCIEVMRQMPENSVDAIVTDPPYGLEFMGKGWDAPWKDSARWRSPSPLPGSHSKNPTPRPQGWGEAGIKFQYFSETWAREAYRVLKPGGHLLAFAGTRTYHRMASGVEDAGFEIRDCIAWMYGSGFPKSLDVSKAIDKTAGAERHIEASAKIEPFGSTVRCATCGKSLGSQLANCRCDTKGVPVTDAARKWSGWGTALKPAFEPVVVARKPLIGTVAQNVLEHGTGAINVDGCRIAGDISGGVWHGSTRKTGYDGGWDSTAKPNTEPHTAGRWPANVTLDEDTAAMLDEQSGVTTSRAANRGALGRGPFSGIADAGRVDGSDGVRGHDDSGGASRFFYTAKASKKDRNTNGANNTHPTVKPTTLMRWLIRLVTPPGGIILDPFGGSGSTGVAARAEGVRCILIEREAEYLDIIRQRLDEGPLFANLD